MMWELPFACRKCLKPFLAKSYKSVDVVANPELRELIMSDGFNLNLCPHCEHPAGVHGPFTLWEDDFAALVLSQPFKAREAVALIQLLLNETKPEREETPTKVLVFSTLEKLRKALVNTELTRMRVPLEQFKQRNLSSVKHPMQEIADALLQQDMPERAFLMYREMIALFNELYFHEDVREELELMAHAAGSRIAPGQIDSKTALEQLQEIDELLAPHAPRFASLDPYQVFYCPIDETGETGEGLQDGDEHVVTALNPFIKSEPVGKDEQARGLLLVMAISSLVLQWLQGPQPDIVRFGALAKMTLGVIWFDLPRHIRHEIGLWYYQTFGAHINEN